MPTIDEYFSRNGIVSKTDADITPEHRRVSGIFDEGKFFNQYFQSELDVLMAGIDFPLNSTQFDLVLDEAKKFSDFFQPCCQSGILGCYIAIGTGAKFKGMDINPFGIEKAKKRAARNGLNPEIFELGDILEYAGEHEAVVGRYVLNTIKLDIDDESVDAVSRISRNLILIQNVQSIGVRYSIRMYKECLERHGYSFEVINEPTEAQSTGAYEFVFKATKP